MLEVGDGPYTCNICLSEYDNDDGGVEGYFGILPVAFCATCFASVVDMVRVVTGIGSEDDYKE